MKKQVLVSVFVLIGCTSQKVVTPSLPAIQEKKTEQALPLIEPRVHPVSNSPTEGIVLAKEDRDRADISPLAMATESFGTAFFSVTGKNGYTGDVSLVVSDSSSDPALAVYRKDENFGDPLRITVQTQKDLAAHTVAYRIPVNGEYAIIGSEQIFFDTQEVIELFAQSQASPSIYESVYTEPQRSVQTLDLGKYQTGRVVTNASKRFRFLFIPGYREHTEPTRFKEYFDYALPLFSEEFVHECIFQTSTIPSEKSVSENSKLLDEILLRAEPMETILVGFSRGGLVAMDLANRMALRGLAVHVITIGTPHWGSPGGVPKMPRVVFSRMPYPQILSAFYDTATNNLYGSLKEKQKIGEILKNPGYRLYSDGFRSLALFMAIPTTDFISWFLNLPIPQNEYLSPQDRFALLCNHSTIPPIIGSKVETTVDQGNCYINECQAIHAHAEYVGARKRTPFVTVIAGVLSREKIQEGHDIVLKKILSRDGIAILGKMVGTLAEEVIQQWTASLMALMPAAEGSNPHFDQSDGLVPKLSALARSLVDGVQDPWIAREYVVESSHGGLLRKKEVFDILKKESEMIVAQQKNTDRVELSNEDIVSIKNLIFTSPAYTPWADNEVTFEGIASLTEVNRARVQLRTIRTIRKSLPGGLIDPQITITAHTEYFIRRNTEWEWLVQE